MNRVARLIVIAGCLLAPASANATLTVTPGLTVHNKCPSDIVIAVRYKDSRGNWSTAPFTSIGARQRKERVVSSNNSIFYYYAESTSGVRWTGDHSVRVGAKTYPMKEKRLTFDRDRNRFLLGLTCTG
jgi:hypothetical protein